MFIIIIIIVFINKAAADYDAPHSINNDMHFYSLKLSILSF